MTLGNFIDGLRVLQPYYKDPNGYHIGAEHDQFYAYPTQRPVDPGDVVKLRRLGWFQPEVDSDGDEDEAPEAQLIDEYDPEEGWSCFT